MSEEDKEAQGDELLALASIYEEGIFTAAEDGSGGQFAAHIQLPMQPLLIALDGPMIDQAKRAGKGIDIVYTKMYKFISLYCSLFLKFV